MGEQGIHPDTVTPAVGALLGALAERSAAVLGDELVGVYAAGSLTSASFDPEASDIDFVVVTAAEVEDGPLDRLRAEHAALRSSGLALVELLEGSYLSADFLRRHGGESDLLPRLEIDGTLERRSHGPEWILERRALRDKGFVVTGPEPRSLIDPVSSDETRFAVRHLLLDFWQRQDTESTWLEPRKYQAFARLTMCRARNTLATGELLSKPDAAAWAQSRLDERWQPLITEALEWRTASGCAPLDETIGFIRDTVRLATLV